MKYPVDNFDSVHGEAETQNVKSNYSIKYK